MSVEKQTRAPFPLSLRRERRGREEGGRGGGMRRAELAAATELLPHTRLLQSPDIWHDDYISIPGKRECVDSRPVGKGETQDAREQARSNKTQQ